MVLSIELAHEYVNLGKLAKAGNIYHNTMNIAKKVPLSEETRVLLLLRYSESQAAAGNVLKRLVRTEFLAAGSDIQYAVHRHIAMHMPYPRISSLSKKACQPHSESSCVLLSWRGQLLPLARSLSFSILE